MFGVAHSGENGCTGVAERDAADGNVTRISGTSRIGASAGVGVCTAGIGTSIYANTSTDAGASMGINAAVRADTGASAS